MNNSIRHKNAQRFSKGPPLKSTKGWRQLFIFTDTMTNRQLQMPEAEKEEDANLEEVTSDIEATPRTVVDPMTATAQGLDELIKEGDEELNQPLLTMAATVDNYV